MKLIEEYGKARVLRLSNPKEAPNQKKKKKKTVNITTPKANRVGSNSQVLNSDPCAQITVTKGSSFLVNSTND